MVAIIVKLLLSVLLTLVGIIVAIVVVYYTLLLLSLLSGLVGMDRVSIFFRSGVDKMSNRIQRVTKIILKGK